MKKILLLLLLGLLFCPPARGSEPQKEKEKKERIRTPKSQAEITLRLVEAGSDPAMANDAVNLIPADLQKLLTFTRYRMLDSGFIRGVEDDGMSIALGGNLFGELKYKLLAGTVPAELEYEVEIRGSRPDKGPAPTLLQTSARGRSGEMVVLGASRMKESSKALIVLLTGKLLSTGEIVK